MYVYNSYFFIHVCRYVKLFPMHGYGTQKHHAKKHLLKQGVELRFSTRVMPRFERGRKYELEFLYRQPKYEPVPSLADSYP